MENLIEAQKEYIYFLEKYIGGITGYLYIHNMSASQHNIDKGKELRDNIEKASKNIINIQKMENQTKICSDHLGYCGRLIAWSKSQYRDSYPNNTVVFNANICTSEGKIWYGDIDVDVDLQKLKDIVRELMVPIYILYEMDARFGNENNPLLKNAVAEFNLGFYRIGDKVYY